MMTDVLLIVAGVVLWPLLCALVDKLRGMR
jgi:hypothetical protein